MHFKFGIGAKISEHVDGAGGLGGMLGGLGGGSGGGGFGGFMGTLGGFGDKLGGLNEKIQAAKESIPIPGLEEQFQNYMEDELGGVKVHFGKICAKVGFQEIFSPETSFDWLKLSSPFDWSIAFSKSLKAKTR